MSGRNQDLVSSWTTTWMLLSSGKHYLHHKRSCTRSHTEHKPDSPCACIWGLWRTRIPAVVPRLPCSCHAKPPSCLPVGDSKGHQLCILHGHVRPCLFFNSTTSNLVFVWWGIMWFHSNKVKLSFPLDSPVFRKHWNSLYHRSCQWASIQASSSSKRLSHVGVQAALQTRVLLKTPVPDSNVLKPWLTSLLLLNRLLDTRISHGKSIFIGVKGKWCTIRKCSSYNHCSSVTYAIVEKPTHLWGS